MRQAVVGLLAHVDAGKTSLAEAMLLEAGVIRTIGRVDHGDAYLDFEGVERERGITVFSKQASFDYHGVHFMLLDTPGHVDFSAEAERTLQVLDACVLVVSANEAVGGHTQTLWRLLERHGVPRMIFVNKIDLVDGSGEETLRELRRRWGEAFVDFMHVRDAEAQETMAMTDERALDELLERGELGDKTIRRIFGEGKVFPCLQGSALRQIGVRDLLDALEFLTPQRSWPHEFGARVYKVTHEKGSERFAWLKVTGGTLHAKESLVVPLPGTGNVVEKVDQLRLYQGPKFNVVQEVCAGRVCVATGLNHALPGTALGFEGQGIAPMLAPVVDYKVIPKEGDIHAVFGALRRLSEEDPMLGVTWEEELEEVRVQIMGSVQLEVLQRRLADEYGIAIDFGPGSILYKETIAEPIIGVGHFEPLRHYAEVHMLLEPLPRGVGIEYGTVCLEDDLNRNWQRLILTNAMERPHRGVLIGAPLTDVRMTLLAGRAHPKHTEGGDFRQATYRAIRQALMNAKNLLLEPWYEFELMVPSTRVGRALADMQRMGARFDAPVVQADDAMIRGMVPASEVGEYALQVGAYTAGQGSFHVELAGYEPCHDANKIIERHSYHPEADLAHTPDSVFCSHGAGYTVKWQDVPAHAHVTPDPDRQRPFRRADESFFSA